MKKLILFLFVSVLMMSCSFQDKIYSIEHTTADNVTLHTKIIYENSLNTPQNIYVDFEVGVYKEIMAASFVFTSTEYLQNTKFIQNEILKKASALQITVKDIFIDYD